jgi:hypothetical protein
MRAVYLFASILSVFILLDLLVLVRIYVLTRGMRGQKYWRTFVILWGIFAIGFCITAALANPLLGGRRDPLPRWLVSAQFIWHFLVLPILVLLLILDQIAHTIRHWLCRAMAPAKPAPQPPSPPANLSRRNFLASAAIVAAPLATASMCAAAASELGKFRVKSYDLAFPAWPKELDGYTITVIADVHVGEFSSQKMLDDIAETSNRLKSDLVLLPGDLINISRADLPSALDMVLRLDSRDGVYLVLGNHDCIQGPGAFVESVRRRGVKILVDQFSVIQTRGAAFQLLGTTWTDEYLRAGSVAYTADLRIPGLFPIMMAHHPHSWDTAAEHEIPLVISGHTHGGQIMLTKSIGAGPLRFRYWSGRYDKPGSTLVVSNGVGNWFPLRVNAPAEILHITMHTIA